MLYDVASQHAQIIGALISSVNRRTKDSEPHDCGVSIGERIAALRKDKGWNQAELARRIGVKQPSIWLIESGNTKSLRADTLMRLASALDSNPYYIWTGFGPSVAAIDPNAEEAQAVDLYRRLSAKNKPAWLEVGSILLRGQPENTPTVLDPYPSAPRSVKTKAAK
jgi:transcriptional regulator with XRE-family HTH domain